MPEALVASFLPSKPSMPLAMDNAHHPTNHDRKTMNIDIESASKTMTRMSSICFNKNPSMDLNLIDSRDSRELNGSG